MSRTMIVIIFDIMCHGPHLAQLINNWGGLAVVRMDGRKNIPLSFG